MTGSAARSAAQHAETQSKSRRTAVTETLRVVTCGSVDDGKSTLIGRLLYEGKVLYDDQLATLEADSKKFGTQGARLDFALLVDGLAAEREQRITIDIAYRYFATGGRHFIVADAPGHEQYTRNMITAASTADIAIILVDASKGLLTQTRRHSYLVSLIGIRHIVLAINKLDLVEYSRDVFESIASAYLAFAAQLGIEDVTSIPISALNGDNIADLSANTPWYPGPSLMEHLQRVPAGGDAVEKPFRMPVQWVNRTGLDFRGFSGRVVGGSVAVGERIRVLPSSKVSTVARIVTFDGDLGCAVNGQSVTLTLEDDIDVSRGDMIAAFDAPPAIADQFEATVIWMSEAPLMPGRQYLLKIGARIVGASLLKPRYKVEVNTLTHVAAETLQLNEIGVCEVHVDQAVAFDPYKQNRDTGGFILIDRISSDTIAAGVLHFSLRQAQDLHWQSIEVDKDAHARLNRHRPCIVWITGLSAAGKSTIANLVEKKLHVLGLHTYTLDGDNVRHGLNKGLGFTVADRVENVRRIAEVARLMVDAGLIVLVAVISPFRAERRVARSLVKAGEFCEVFLDVPLSIAEQRDPKGLYRKARRHELTNFTGIDSPYERPEDPELRIDGATTTPEAAADLVISRLRAMGILDAL